MTAPFADSPRPPRSSALIAYATRSEAEWANWLGEPSGRRAWADGELVTETNAMRQAIPGEMVDGRLKSAATRDGLDTWETL